MSDGLITRIGKWWDAKFEETATVAQVEAVKDYAISQDRQIGMALADTIKQVADVVTRTQEIRNVVNEMLNEQKRCYGDHKDLADLKTRIEKLELYTGMGRKIDPTKQPVVKSAFSM